MRIPDKRRLAQRSGQTVSTCASGSSNQTLAASCCANHDEQSFICASIHANTRQYTQFADDDDHELTSRPIRGNQTTGRSSERTSASAPRQWPAPLFHRAVVWYSTENIIGHLLSFFHLANNLRDNFQSSVVKSDQRRDSRFYVEPFLRACFKFCPQDVSTRYRQESR